jgi:hypothetical protein
MLTNLKKVSSQQRPSTWRCQAGPIGHEPFRKAFILSQREGVQNRLAGLEEHTDLKEAMHPGCPTRLAELKKHADLKKTISVSRRPA